MLMIVLDASAKSETPSSTESSGLDLSKHHNRPFIVTVDAGHGGVDPGATGHHGTHEKEVTLAIARQLAARLNQQSGIKAVLTRDSDIFLPLRERINRARQAQADLFISIHADAVENSSVAGASVYVLSEHGASSEAAKWLADQQNSADLVGGIKLENKDKALASVLLDLTQSAAMSSSMVAAEKVITQLNTVGEVRKTQVQQAGFVVLKSPDIPSMLIESAYITNPEEEDHLKDPVYQAKLADAVVIGVKQYFKENATPGARVAKR
jgi:N-acetylmuramoyl-L-alanine amidase